MQNHQYDTPAINGAVTKIAGGVSDKYAILLQIKVLRSRVCIRMQSQHNSGAMLYLCWNFSPNRYCEHNIGTMLYRCWITTLKFYLCWYCEFNIGTMLYRCWTTMLNFNQDSTNHNQISTWYQRWIDVEFALKHQYWQSTWFQHISMLYQCCVLLGRYSCNKFGKLSRCYQQKVRQCAQSHIYRNPLTVNTPSDSLDLLTIH